MKSRMIAQVLVIALMAAGSSGASVMHLKSLYICVLFG